LLDNEPLPPQSREEKLRNERLSHAAEKKLQFLQQFYIKQLHIQLDHNYTSKASSETASLKVPVVDNQVL